MMVEKEHLWSSIETQTSYASKKYFPFHPRINHNFIKFGLIHSVNWIFIMVKPHLHKVWY